MKTIIITYLLLLLSLSKRTHKHFRHSIDLLTRLSPIDSKLNKTIRKHLDLLKFRKKKNGLTLNDCRLELVDSSIQDNQCLVNYRVSSDLEKNQEVCNQVEKAINQ